MTWPARTKVSTSLKLQEQVRHDLFAKPISPSSHDVLLGMVTGSTCVHPVPAKHQCATDSRNTLHWRAVAAPHAQTPSANIDRSRLFNQVHLSGNLALRSWGCLSEFTVSCSSRIELRMSASLTHTRAYWTQRQLIHV